MNESGGRKYYYFDLTEARTGQLERVLGSFIRVVRASSATATIKVAVGRNLEDHYEELTKNGKIPVGEGFKRLYFANDAQPGEWVIVMVNDGAHSYDVENTSLGNIASVGSIDDPVEIAAHSTLVTTADDSIAATTTEQILAANTDRKEALITNLADNGAKIRVGDANTGAGRGIEVSPGQTITLNTTAAIYVYNEGASAQSVAILEVE